MDVHGLASAIGAYFCVLHVLRSQHRAEIHAGQESLQAQRFHPQLQHLPSDRLHVLRRVVGESWNNLQKHMAMHREPNRPTHGDGALRTYLVLHDPSDDRAGRDGHLRAAQETKSGVCPAHLSSHQHHRLVVDVLEIQPKYVDSFVSDLIKKNSNLKNFVAWSLWKYF